MNLEVEIRNGYKVSPEMKKVWAIELQLLQKLLEVCKKYDLKIVSCGGTCLGAVREKGFIPWDDDIDMEMLRTDYDKLVSVAEEEFQYPYFFQCFQTEDHYCSGHAQLRMSTTTAIGRNDCRDINHGIPLDIFVLDAIPTTQEQIDKLRKESLSIKKRLLGYSFFDWSFYYGGTLNSIFSWVYVKCVGFDKLYKRYEDLFRAYSIDDSENVAVLAFNWGQVERGYRNKRMFDDILWLPFEDTMVPVPAMYDELLTRFYGDYMEPVKGCSLHSGYDVLDAERPYTEYLPMTRKKNRKESIKRKFMKLFQFVGK